MLIIRRVPIILRTQLVAVALLLTGQPSIALAIEYLGAEFTSHNTATVRDYYPTNDPILYEEISGTVPYLGGGAVAHRVLADVSRVGRSGLRGSASSESRFTYRPIQVGSGGSASITQTTKVHGYYDDEIPNDVKVAECWANAYAESILIHLRVEEADGPVVFQSFRAERAEQVHPGSALNNPLFGVHIYQNDQLVGGNGTILSPGAWEIQIASTGNGTSILNSGPWEFNSDFSAIWTFSGVFPGQTFENYAKGITGHDTPSDDPDEDPPPASDPDTIAGVNLTMPIIGDLGHTGKFFAGIPTQVEAGPLSGAQVTGYTVTSEYAPLTSIVVPALPGGGEILSITFNEQTLPVVAGQEIDFGPGGAEEFTISGFDPTAPTFAPGDFVMGLQFAEEGLASLTAIPTLYIPPGDYNENGLVDAADYTVWRDGLGGAYDESHYDQWKQNFGAPAASSSATAHTPVPEPAAWIVILGGLASFFILRRREIVL